jgi:hypothetical protein
MHLEPSSSFPSLLRNVKEKNAMLKKDTSFARANQC